MRVILKKGKQKELIEKSKGKASWKEFSNKLEISESYLKSDLRKERSTLQRKIFDNLNSLVDENFEKHIVEELSENWGRSKGGRNSAENLAKKIKIPKNSRKLAEFYGIMLGDGHLSKIKGHKIGTYELKITGDSRKDKEYLEKYVKKMIEKLFCIKVKISMQKNTNCLIVKAHGRKLVEFLESKGFKPGNKLKNKLKIPSWIRKDKELLKACIRGLYDTDGGIYKLNGQRTIQICFTNYNEELIREVRESLISLDINASKIYNNKRLYITKKSELRKFLKHIGFSNQKHKSKVALWNI